MGAIEAAPALVARALARGAVALAMGCALHSASSGAFEVCCIMAIGASLKFQPHRSGNLSVCLDVRVEQSRSGPSVQPVRHWQCGTPVSAAVHTPLAGLVQLLLQIGTAQGDVRLRYGRVVGGCGVVVGT